MSRDPLELDEPGYALRPGEPCQSVGVSLEWLGGFVIGVAVFVRKG